MREPLTVELNQLLEFGTLSEALSEAFVQYERDKQENLENAFGPAYLRDALDEACDIVCRREKERRSLDIVMKDGMKLGEVPLQTPQVCFAAIMQNPLSIDQIKEPEKIIPQLRLAERMHVAREFNGVSRARIRDGEPLQSLDKLAEVFSQDTSFEIRNIIQARNLAVKDHLERQQRDQKFIDKFKKPNMDI